MIDLQPDSNGLSARLAADSEAFLPCGGGTGGAPLGERTISKGNLSPGKAAVIVCEQVGCCYGVVVLVGGSRADNRDVELRNI